MNGPLFKVPALWNNNYFEHDRSNYKLHQNLNSIPPFEALQKPEFRTYLARNGLNPVRSYTGKTADLRKQNNIWSITQPIIHCTPRYVLELVRVSVCSDVGHRTKAAVGHWAKFQGFLSSVEWEGRSYLDGRFWRRLRQTYFHIIYYLYYILL